MPLNLGDIPTAPKDGDPNHPEGHTAIRRELARLDETDRIVRGLPLVLDVRYPTQYPDAAAAINDYLNDRVYGGGVAVIPSGRYRLSSTLQTRWDDVQFKCEWPCVFYPDDGVTAITILPDATWANDVLFQDFIVRGGAKGIHVQPGNYQTWGRFQHVQCVGQSEIGVHFEGVLYSSILESVVCSESPCGMMFDRPIGGLGEHHRNTLVNCQWVKCEQFGLWAAGLDFTHMITPYIEANLAHGMYLENCFMLTLDSIYCESNQVAGQEGAPDIEIHGARTTGSGSRAWCVYIRNPYPGPPALAQGSPPVFVGCSGDVDGVNNLTYEGALYGKAIRWLDGSLTTEPVWGQWRDGVKVA